MGMAAGGKAPYAWAALATVVVLLAGTVILLRPAPKEPIRIVLPAQRAEPAEITVHVAGAVTSPGLYSLGAAERVSAAVEAAGGAVDGADLEHLNLAARLKDGDQVLVPRRGEPLPLGTAGGRRVNLNAAKETDLDALPGIGAVRAQRIVASRNRDGAFREPLEIVSRGLVPLSVYQQIKDVLSTQ